MKLTKDEAGAITLSFAQTAKLVDISPLKGLPIQHLILNWTKVSDISALKGMKLTSANLSQTKIKDFSVLKGMPLVTLSLPMTAKNIDFLRSSKTMYLINSHKPDKFWKFYDGQNKKSKIENFFVNEGCMRERMQGTAAAALLTGVADVTYVPWKHAEGSANTTVKAG